jgi:uncharacterized protein YodC (DUF2158 family)
MAFRVGDVVQLRYGGGPQMRVEKVTVSDGNEWVTVVWGASNECHNYFVAEMLTAAEAPRSAAPKVAASRTEPPRPEPPRAKPAPVPVPERRGLWQTLTSWLTGAR